MGYVHVEHAVDNRQGCSSYKNRGACIGDPPSTDQSAQIQATAI